MKAVALVLLAACSAESTSAPMPDRQPTCLEECEAAVERCWPNGYHEDRIDMCLIERDQCRNACLAPEHR